MSHPDTHQKNTRPRKAAAALIALLLCLPVALATSGSADKQAAPARALLSSTTSTDEYGAKSTVNLYDDGSGDMTVDMSATEPAVGARAACGPKLTDADIERWINDTSADTPPQPVATGASTCTAKTGQRTLAGSTGLWVPDAICGIKHGSGDDVHGKLCVNYTVTKRTDRKTNWSASASSTAWSSDDNCVDCDRIKDFKTYAKTNLGPVIEWRPTGTVTIDEGCVTKTLTIAYEGSGASTSAQQCPELYGSWAIGLYSSGARWHTDFKVGRGVTRSADFVHFGTSTRSSLDWTTRFFVAWD